MRVGVKHIINMEEEGAIDCASNTLHGAFLGTFRLVGLYKKVLYTTV